MYSLDNFNYVDSLAIRYLDRSIDSCDENEKLMCLGIVDRLIKLNRKILDFAYVRTS